MINKNDFRRYVDINYTVIFTPGRQSHPFRSYCSSVRLQPWNWSAAVLMSPISRQLALISIYSYLQWLLHQELIEFDIRLSITEETYQNELSQIYHKYSPSKCAHQRQWLIAIKWWTIDTVYNTAGLQCRSRQVNNCERMFLDTWQMMRIRNRDNHDRFIMDYH